MITAYEIIVNILMWSYSLFLFVAAFYVPTAIASSLLVFLSFIALYQAILDMELSFLLDEKINKGIKILD